MGVAGRRRGDTRVLARRQPLRGWSASGCRHRPRRCARRTCACLRGSCLRGAGPDTRPHGHDRRCRRVQGLADPPWRRFSSSAARPSPKERPWPRRDRPAIPSTTSRTSTSASGSATTTAYVDPLSLLPPRAAPIPPPAPAAPPAPAPPAPDPAPEPPAGASPPVSQPAPEPAPTPDADSGATDGAAAPDPSLEERRTTEPVRGAEARPAKSNPDGSDRRSPNRSAAGSHAARELERTGGATDALVGAARASRMGASGGARRRAPAATASEGHAGGVDTPAVDTAFQGGASHGSTEAPSPPGDPVPESAPVPGVAPSRPGCRCDGAARTFRGELPRRCERRSKATPYHSAA